MNDLTDVEAMAETRPTLLKDRSFWGLSVTQFLGAFNDNLYKQLLLLLAVPVAVAGLADQPAAGPGAGGGAGAAPVDVQGWALFVFSIPFVIFSGYAGYLSDRNSKQPIIWLCKIAEIVITFLAMLAFLFYDTLGMVGTWTVLFLMGTQSAFFGPGKYGIIPELFRKRDAAAANGIILMSTFLAIIFGTVAAGVLKVALVGDGQETSRLWIASLPCMAIAIVGTLTAWMIRRTPVADPNLQLTNDALTVPVEVRQALGSDRPLLMALLASCVFWLVAGTVMPTINALGLTQLKVDAAFTSLLTASTAIGIMAGAMLAGIVSRLKKTDRLVTIGMWGIVGTLLALGMWGGGGQHVLGFYGSILALIILGVFSAIYSVPLQVFLQQRPAAEIKGRMIATMNQANFVGILIAGPVYQLFERLAAWGGLPISSIFWMIGLLVLPLAIFYRLDSEQPTNAQFNPRP